MACSAVAFLLIVGCAGKPLLEYSTDTPAMALLPISKAGLIDGRARFREIFCAISAARGPELPDHRPCDDALVKLSDEGRPTGRPVTLGAGSISLTFLLVPGVGWDCVEHYLDANQPSANHVANFGYTMKILDVEPLSSSARNAELIRDAVMAMPAPAGEERLVLLGYSKGAPDILEAITAYPELESRITAVVSTAGAIGGSPLANTSSQDRANLLVSFPGADCVTGDAGAVESLKPAVRRQWLATHSLPKSIHYYSLATYPAPERISYLLQASYDKLSQIDPHNDSQLIVHDQFIPGSVLMGFLNADHWAIAVPISRTHKIMSSTLVNKNDFPREVLLEAMLRFVEEDLSDSAD
jgi:hypothetical protein